MLEQTALVFMSSLVRINFTREQPKHTATGERQALVPALPCPLFFISEYLRIADLDKGSNLSEVTQLYGVKNRPVPFLLLCMDPVS